MHHCDNSVVQSMFTLNTCTGNTMSEYSIQSLGLSIKATHVEVLCGFSIINGKTLVF